MCIIGVLTKFIREPKKKKKHKNTVSTLYTKDVCAVKDLCIYYINHWCSKD